MKLRKRNVDALAPGDRVLEVWDDELAGFGLKVHPSGRKTYVVRYRTATSRQRWLTLGTHGALTPDQARRLAQDKLAEVRHGGDPAETRTAERQAATVDELLDRYVTEHVPVRNKARTAEAVASVLRLHLRPAVGRMKVAAVTGADVARLHQAMAATPRQANLTVAILSKAMSLAERWGMRPRASNPCLGLERYRETARDRFLSDAELQRLGEVMKAAEGREHPTVLAAILLLLLTGRRVSELCSIRWADVDLDRGAVRLGDTKAGSVQHHALSAGAVRVITTLDRVKGSPWVLPAPENAAKPLSRHTVGQVWQRLRAAAGLDDVRVHDLRHTVGTFAGASGANAFLIRDVLGHRTLSMTERYVSRDVEPMRAIAETVGARVLAGLALDEGAAVMVPAAARFDPAADVLAIRLGEGGGEGMAGEPLEVRPVFDAAGALVGVEIPGASALMPALRPARQRATSLPADVTAAPTASPGGAGRVVKRKLAARPAKKVQTRRKPSRNPSQ